MRNKAYCLVLWMLLMLLATTLLGDPDVVITQVTIPTTLPSTQPVVGMQTTVPTFQTEPVPVPTEPALPMISVEPEWAQFPPFDIDFELLSAFRTSSGFFSQDGFELRLQQNLLPLAAIGTLFSLSGATPTLLNFGADIEKVLSGDVNLSAIANSDFHFGHTVDNFGIGVFMKSDVDSLLFLPEWVAQTIAGKIPPANDVYDFSGSVIDIHVSAGIFAALKFDYFQVAGEIGMYTPILTSHFNTTANLVSNGAVYAGTATVDGLLYSSADLGALDLFTIPHTLLTSGGWKADLSVLIGKEKTLAGFSVSNIPITAAKLNYIAPWDLNFEASSLSATPTMTTTEKLIWTPAAHTYRIKTVIAGFVNVPFSEVGFFQLHGKWRPLSGTDIGGMLNFFITDGFSLMGDFTYNTSGFYDYSVGLGFYGEKTRTNIDIGIGSRRFFDYATLTSPRISISSSASY